MINLYERKVSRMANNILLEECIIYLKILASQKIDSDGLYRLKILIKEALTRPALQAYHNDFNIALRVINLL